MAANQPKVIAFYLPQYHPTPDNDKWWGKGFTEWTNVGKAKPLFPGHDQPKVPTELGYYDLRLPDTREAQAQMAKEAGIYGFCYYHYWFGNGKEELELPFNEVLRLGKPDFPFMLCWANESWHRKFWNKDANGTSKEILAEQTYPGDEDHIAHFYRLLPAFQDPRYIKIDGKPVFMIYCPNQLPEAKKFIELWNNLARQNNLNGFYFIAQKRADSDFSLNDKETYEYLKSLGFDGLNIVRLTEQFARRNPLGKLMDYCIRRMLKHPLICSYKEASQYFIDEFDKTEGIFPTLIPNWDHSPRSQAGGRVLTNCTPELFKEQISTVLNITDGKKQSTNLVFLKSWNEWGEGNYVEPDLTYGRGYLDALKSELVGSSL